MRYGNCRDDHAKFRMEDVQQGASVPAAPPHPTPAPQPPYPSPWSPKASIRGNVHDIFISYHSRESDATFTALMGTFKVLGYKVFNQKRDLAGHDVNLAEMQRHAADSRLVLALLSPCYFASIWCRGELEAAASARVPIVPVFSGEDFTRKSILALKDKADPTTFAAVKAAFMENLIDINNGDHADQVVVDIKEKIVARFFTTPSDI